MEDIICDKNCLSIKNNSKINNGIINDVPSSNQQNIHIEKDKNDYDPTMFDPSPLITFDPNDNK